MNFIFHGPRFDFESVEKIGKNPARPLIYSFSLIYYSLGNCTLKLEDSRWIVKVQTLKRVASYASSDGFKLIIYVTLEA